MELICVVVANIYTHTIGLIVFNKATHTHAYKYNKSYLTSRLVVVEVQVLLRLLIYEYLNFNVILQCDTLNLITVT